MEITAIYYLIPSLIMFCCGVYGFITRKNMIAMLISLELMLNAVDAAETALAIAIIINIFRATKNVDVRGLNEMKF